MQNIFSRSEIRFVQTCPEVSIVPFSFLLNVSFYGYYLLNIILEVAGKILFPIALQHLDNIW